MQSNFLIPFSFHPYLLIPSKNISASSISVSLLCYLCIYHLFSIHSSVCPLPHLLLPSLPSLSHVAILGITNIFQKFSAFSLHFFFFYQLGPYYFYKKPLNLNVSKNGKRLYVCTAEDYKCTCLLKLLGFPGSAKR